MYTYRPHSYLTGPTPGRVQTTVRGISLAGTDPSLVCAFEDRTLEFGIVTYTVRTVILKAKHRVRLSGPDHVRKVSPSSSFTNDPSDARLPS